MDQLPGAVTSLAARRLGYRITRIDLQQAWEEERREYQREAQR